MEIEELKARKTVLETKINEVLTPLINDFIMDVGGWKPAKLSVYFAPGDGLKSPNMRLVRTNVEMAI